MGKCLAMHLKDDLTFRGNKGRDNVSAPQLSKVLAMKFITFVEIE